MNRLEHTLDLGSADTFPLAREAILTWKLQESAGVIARPARPAHVGQIIDLWLNPAWPRRAMHLRVTIASESVPGHSLLRAFAPLSVAAQTMMARRYATGLKRMLQRQSDVDTKIPR